MSEPITLTADEADALREVLAALSVIEDRGLRHDHVIEITRETWRAMLIRPAQRLRRVGQDWGRSGLVLGPMKEDHPYHPVLDKIAKTRRNGTRVS